MILKIGALTAGITSAVAGAVGSLAGFSTAGVVAGSAAAGIQAGIGNIIAGSAFAIAQSLGATGVFVVLGPIGAAVAVAAVVLL